jgi:phosphoheptose isomerase
MSNRATFNDSIAAIRTIFDLEETVALAADSLRATLLAGRKVLVCGNGGTSGKSENIKRALEEGKRLGLRSISLLGRDGGFCRGLADLELLIPEQVTARIQEAHKVIIHLLCELVEPDLAKE